MQNIAISYARFSSAGQATGSSLARQSQKAEIYAAEHGLILDHSKSFKDLGVSAYDQSNIQKGALGLFLKAVEQGQIGAGTTLIIESFDRLSRATPATALGIFLQIIKAGLNLVVLTTPPKVFNEASVDANIFQLMEALMEMYRAHEESKTKGMRVGDKWKRKRQRAIEDGVLMSAKVPHWMDGEVNHAVDNNAPNRRVVKLNAEKAAVVLQIVQMAEKGIGNNTIIKNLHASKTLAWSMVGPKGAREKGNWQPSYLQKLLTSVSLYGAIELDGEIVKDYYPPIITEERYHRLRALRSARATTKNTSRKGHLVTNLFSGLLKCGYCGESMNIAGYKSLKTGYERKYVACHGARIGKTQCKMKMWFIDELEPAMLFWLTTVDYSKLMNPTGRTDLVAQQEHLALLKSQLLDFEKRVENMMIAIEEGATNMITRLKEREADVMRIKKLVIDQERKVQMAASQEGGGASRMKGLVLLFKAFKHTTDPIEIRTLREQLSAMINGTVQKIQLYPAGRDVTGTKEDRYAEITFDNGATRTVEPSEC